MALCLSLAAWSIAEDARAGDACDGDGPPIVFVAFAGERWDDTLARGVMDHLRAGLGPAGFRVCPAVLSGAGGRAVATVELRRNPGERVVATIEVRDGVTEKRIARDIDLSALPEDGRALGVGVAADELLRASWLELALEDAPKPAEPPPREVQRTVDRALERRVVPTTSEVGVRAAMENYGGGLRLLGGDLALVHWFARPFGAELSLGLRQAPSDEATHGAIRASAFTLGGSVLAEVVRSGALGLRCEAGVDAVELRLRGEPSSGAEGASGAELAVFARAGAALAFTVARSLVLTVRAGGGAPLRAVHARDYGERATGASGPEWYGSIGPSLAF